MEVRHHLDPSARAVLADWLTAQGDARGELIAMELRLDELGAPGEKDERAQLRARVEALRGELEARWHAELAARAKHLFAMLQVLLFLQRLLLSLQKNVLLKVYRVLLEHNEQGMLPILVLSEHDLLRVLNLWQLG